MTIPREMTGRELEALADRVAALEGPCREVDCRIWLLVGEKMGGNWHVRSVDPIRPSEIIQGRWMGSALDKWPDDTAQTAANYCVPKFTASIDAAMSLVPEGGDWSVDNFDGDCGWPSAWVYQRRSGDEIKTVTGRTPATALCAAALPARASAAPVIGGGE